MDAHTHIHTRFQVMIMSVLLTCPHLKRLKMNGNKVCEQARRFGPWSDEEGKEWGERAKGLGKSKAGQVCVLVCVEAPVNKLRYIRASTALQSWCQSCTYNPAMKSVVCTRYKVDGASIPSTYACYFYSYHPKHPFPSPPDLTHNNAMILPTTMQW